MEGSCGKSEFVRVKEEAAEPEAEPDYLPPGAAREHNKEEPQNGHYLIRIEVDCVKQETECGNEMEEDRSCSDSECGVREATMLAGLGNHRVNNKVVHPELVPSQTAPCSDSECGVSEATILAGLGNHRVKDEVIQPDLLRSQTRSYSDTECGVSEGTMLASLGNNQLNDEVVQAELVPSQTGSCSDSECGVSEATMLAGLGNHRVKDEVIQPELVRSQTGSCLDSECGVSQATIMAGLGNHRVKDEVIQPELLRSQTGSDSECGVSEAALLAGLYTDHEVKDELVLGPECPYRPEAIVVNGGICSVLRDCRVTLERLPHVEALVKRQDTTHSDEESDEQLYSANRQTHDTTYTDTESDELHAREKTICPLCDESFSIKSDLVKHAMDHIHRASSAEREESGYSYAFADPWKKEQERALCRKYDIQDCCVRLERIPHREALANDTHITQTDTESDTEDIRIDYEKPTCDLCGESFALKSDLKDHVMVHIYMPTHHPQASPDIESDTEDKYIDIERETEPICEICGENFTLNSNLMKHVMILMYSTRVKELHENYECDICCQIFQMKNRLKQHIEKHSTQRNKELKCNNTWEESYYCEICGKRFITKSRLKRHLLIHTDIRPYSCGVCEKRFRYATHLKTHTRIHGDIRPYFCNVCQKRFRTGTDLKIHTRIHSGERPYTCNMCEKRFISNSRLHGHIRIHTGFGPYACDVCKQRFKRVTWLKIHRQIHNGI